MDATSRLFFADHDAVDRCCDARVDDGRIEQMRGSDAARFLFVRRGRVRAVAGAPPRLYWAQSATLDDDKAPLAVAFLGVWGEHPRFAVIPFEVPVTANDRALGSTDEDDYVGLRRAAMLMSAPEAQLAGHAVHLANWLNRNRYCGSCGAAMRALEGGHKLSCTVEQCKREEFPRTDPVVITLVTRGNRCLLARQPAFPPKFYSALAGFVEPGETLETAVRREVKEETGVTVDGVRYAGSQPWPFPTSLMIGYLAETKDEKLMVDRRELEDARWFDRSEVMQLAAATTQTEFLLPPKGVMARYLIDAWLEQEQEQERTG